MTEEALAGVSGDVGAWMTQAEAWRQKAEKAEAERDRYLPIVEAAKKIRDLTPWIVVPVGSKGRDIHHRLKKLADALAALAAPPDPKETSE